MSIQALAIISVDKTFKKHSINYHQTAALYQQVKKEQAEEQCEYLFEMCIVLGVLLMHHFLSDFCLFNFI